MAPSRDYISFTLNLRDLINVACQDPLCKQEVLLGLQDAAKPLTTQLGAANLTPGDGVDPTWLSLFPATVKGKKPGEAGLIYRNNSKGGKGDRIQMRLKRQKDRSQPHVANTTDVQAPAAPPIPDLPGVDMSNPQVMAIIRGLQAALQSGQLPIPAEASQAAAPATTTKHEPTSAAADIPEDIARACGIAL